VTSLCDAAGGYAGVVNVRHRNDLQLASYWQGERTLARCFFTAGLRLAHLLRLYHLLGRPLFPFPLFLRQARQFRLFLPRGQSRQEQRQVQAREWVKAEGRIQIYIAYSS
jgi:hypothetical protein